MQRTWDEMSQHLSNAMVTVLEKKSVFTLLLLNLLHCYTMHFDLKIPELMLTYGNMST